LRYSIIRRSVGVTIAFLVGHGLNYGLVFGANRILEAGKFGLLYTVLLVITVAMSPMVAATFALSRRLAEVSVVLGHAKTEAITSRVLDLIIWKGIPGALLAGIVLAIVGSWVGVDSWAISFLVPATVLTLIATEVLRTAFQSMLLFRRAAALWIMSVGAQCVLAIIGLLLFDAVWSGILGILIGSMAAAIPFAWQFQRAAHSSHARKLILTMGRHLRREFSAIAAYSLFILFNNLDILVGYWLLPRLELDIYAASAFLPKAIVTAGYPIAQVVLPVIIGQKADGVSFRFSVLKAIAMALVVGAIGAAVFWITVPILQTAPVAIRSLDLPIMNELLIAAVGLGATRILVVVEIALGRVLMGLVQIAAVAIFVVACALTVRSSLWIAELYAATSWAYLIMAIIGVASMTERKVFRLLLFWQK
jgi:hypothetical protein